MRSKPKGPERASRAKSKARRQLGKDPSEREVKDLLEGSTKALTTAVREKLSGRSGPEGAA